MATATAALAPAMTAAAPAAGGSLAPAQGSTELATNAGGADAAVPYLSQGFVDNFRRVIAQPGVRRALPYIILLIVMIIFGLSYAWMNATPQRPVMPGLQEADQQKAFETLKNAGFSPRIDRDSGQLTVPSNRFHEARIYLASQGLPKAGSLGLEGLKDQSAMTTSQFMEQVKVNAAMEQELARSIMQIGSVQSARVHLASPKQSVFVRDRTPPKASVVIAPYPGRLVSAQQVQAIVHLVSSSVPYLSPDNVTVVDNNGKLMTDSATELKLGLTAAQNQHKNQIEDLYRQRIEQILSPMVGEANVRSQVNLSLDFTQIETTTEDFDNRKNGPKTRSEVLAEDRQAVKAAEGIPGSLSNKPPANVTTSTTTAADEKKGQTEGQNTLSSRSTRNYELDRSVRHVTNATGGITRVSVAVVVNERPVPPPAKDAKVDPNAPKSIPYTDKELEKMQQLVRSVVGFDQQRGDMVSVIQTRFEAPPPMPTIPWYIEDTVQTGFKSGLVALSFIIFMLIVVRPIMRNIMIQKEQEAEEQAKQALLDGELSPEDMRMIQIGEGESLEEIKAKLKPKKSSISIDMLDTANTYDDKVALIRMLVAEDSGRVANVLKSMIKVA